MNADLSTQSSGRSSATAPWSGGPRRELGVGSDLAVLRAVHAVVQVLLVAAAGGGR